MKNNEILLSKEETDFIEELENKELNVEKLDNDTLDRYSSYAKYTNSLNQKKQTTIRFSVNDLAIVKARAKELGIGYQNLIQALVHKYAKGQIKLEI